MVVLAACLALSPLVCAQVTAADFNRALDIQEKYNHLAINLPEPPVWQESSDTFVYRKTVEGGHEFILVDAAAQTKQPAFDHARLAAALSVAGEKPYTATTLPFARFEFVAGRAAIEFMADGARWHCDLSAYTCSRRPGRDFDNIDDPDSWGYDPTPKPNHDPDKTVASPDGQWLAYWRTTTSTCVRKTGSRTPTSAKMVPKAITTP